MSEKGQGEESAEGTGTGVGTDGTPPAGGGGAADQSGPDEGDTQTRGRGEWSYDDPDLGELKASDAPPPPLPEEGQAAEPEIPGGGPTDTRTYEDIQEKPPESPADTEPPETPEAKAAREEANRERHQRAYDDAMARRDAQRAAEEGPQIEPPDLKQDGGADSGNESVLKHLPPNENKPVVS